jgi:hypothetical protein
MMRGLRFRTCRYSVTQIVLNAGGRAPENEYTATPRRAQMKPVQIKRHAETTV